jgi:molybdopterin-binding protein
MEKIGLTVVNKIMYHKQFKCSVEVISRGHFPTTVMVKLPDGQEVETDLGALE